MPTLIPFKALQVKPEFISKVAASSSDFNSEQELIEELIGNPNNYLHMSKSHLIDTDLTSASEEFFQNAKVRFDYLLDSEIITELNKEIFYVYRQTEHGVSHTGIIGLCDIVDYQSDKIKKHEHTRPSTEKFLANYIESTEVIGEPVLLSHHHKQSLEDLLRLIIQTDPMVDYEKLERRHQIWQIEDPDVISVIENEVSSLDELYIMDGHHRVASVSNLYKEYGTEEYRYCVSFLLDSNQLTISPFHRLVEGESISFETLVSKLEPSFAIEEIPDYAIRPEHKGEFVLRCSEGSFRLIHKQSSPQLDVQLLEETVLKQIFGVTDSRLDDRIRFIAADEDLTGALLEASMPGKYLFLLYPCTFEEIAEISDNNQFMPPKSTFVEPKCDSGMFIQRYGKSV